MRLVKKGEDKSLWRGMCRSCKSVFEEDGENIKKKHQYSDPTYPAYYEYAKADCPECGAVNNNAVFLYPVSQ